jgi:ABC-type uncharacterized transport system substrate-binding protein
MRRREFITLIGGTAATWPLGARAQQSTRPVIGFINAASARGYARQVAAFLKGLSETGFVDGQNVAIEYRWADGNNDRLPAMASDLVRRHVALIAATTTPAVLAAKAATTAIPIVFEIASDPIELGFVGSLSRPDGNLTGVTQSNLEVAAKRLELIHELVPSAHTVVVLVNPAEPTIAKATASEMLAAARTLGLELHVLNVSSETDFDGIFEKLKEFRAGALIIGGGPFLNSYSEHLGRLTARHAVPAVCQNREFVTAGGLMSYGSDFADAYRLAGVYAGRLLKGEKTADLPVQQATKVELIINLKSAKALGINVPNTLIGRADEVIE